MRRLKRFLKRMWAVLLILFALLTGFVLICIFNPALSERLGRKLEPKNPEKVSLTQPEADVRSSNSENFDSENWDNNPDAGLTGTISRGYVPPAESEISIPASVQGRTGYEPIQSDEQQVDENEAKQLARQLGYGELGEGLAFDERFYPYYAMLGEQEKSLYRQIYANANALIHAFAPIEKVRVGQLKNVFMAVYNDHPELFWLNTAYACSYDQNGQCVEIQLEFYRIVNDLDAARGLFRDHANQILQSTQGLFSDYEKEKAVHDILIDSITYRMGAEMNQSAYSALVNGQTVCAGYARAFQYLMQQLGIPCYYCTGYAGERHAWNIVELEDGYYNADVTWDDTEGGRYVYFNKTDQDYAGTHIRRELSVYLPPCNGQAYRNLEQENGEAERTLEANNAAAPLRSLEEAGFTEEMVLHSMTDYYADCARQIMQNGVGSYTFFNVIDGEELLREWSSLHSARDYEQAYLQDTMESIGARSCQMNIATEEFSGNRYLLIHRVDLK